MAFVTKEELKKPKERVYTTILKRFVEKKLATEIFEDLRDNIKWQLGVGNSRLAKPLTFEDASPQIQGILVAAIAKFKKVSIKDVLDKFNIYGIYLNFYRDGDDYTGSHTHTTSQIVVSFGSMRTLKVGAKEYHMRHGHVIMFGRSAHGVPKEKVKTKDSFGGQRISVAAFFE